jgi:hypothetical protein
METKEYRTRDKSEWGPGAWQDEPDKAQFMDEPTGLPCLIVRNNSGALCGYVGVTEGHPYFGKDYDSSASVPHICDESCDAENDYHSHSSSVGGHLSVHGGITFSDFCSDHSEAAYQRFVTRLEGARDEAKRYPVGDAAQLIREWGGLDYAAWKARREATGICHITTPGESDRVWWFGFDCSHSGDVSPAYQRKYGFAGGYDSYKSIGYVRHEIRELAKQLASVA